MSRFDLHLSVDDVVFPAEPIGRPAIGDVVTWQRAKGGPASSGVLVHTTTRGWAYVDTCPPPGGIRYVTRLPVLALRAAGEGGRAS